MRLIRSKKCIVFMIVLSILVLVLILLKYNGIIGNSPEMPEIVFECIKYDELEHIACEITFIDKYGACYYSNDSDVISESFYGELIDAYKNGTIKDKIKLLKHCNKNEVKKAYRKLCKIAEKGDTIMLSSFLPLEWSLKGAYYNKYDDIKHIILKEKRGDYEHTINDSQGQIPQGDQICEWYNDIMSEVEKGD